MGTDEGGSGTHVTGIHVALKMGSRDDSILAKLETAAQNGVLQFGPHLGKAQCRTPSQRGMTRGIAAVGTQEICVVLGPCILAHLDEGTRSHIQFLGGCCTAVAGVVGALQEVCQCRGLFGTYSVQPEALRHDRFHDILLPWRLSVSLLTARCVTLCLTPLPLNHVIDKVHTGSVGRCRQEVACIRHLVVLDIGGVAERDNLLC